MREDKLPELGAKDPLFLYPHLELHRQTSIAVLSLSTLAALSSRAPGSSLHSGVGTPSCGQLRNYFISSRPGTHHFPGVGGQRNSFPVI